MILNHYHIQNKYLISHIDLLSQHSSNQLLLFRRHRQCRCEILFEMFPCIFLLEWFPQTEPLEQMRNRAERLPTKQPPQTPVPIARFFFSLSWLNPLSQLFGIFAPECSEPVFIQCLPNLFQQGIIEIQVVCNGEPSGKLFLCLEQMANIRSGEVLADRAVALRV